MSIQKTIHDFLVQDYEMAPGRESIDYDEPLLDGGLIDSLGILKLIGFLEEEYQITFDEDAITAESFASINAISRLVEFSTKAHDN